MLPKSGTTMEPAFVKKLTEITEANISNPKFGVDELAREMGMSSTSLYRKVQQRWRLPVK